MEIGRGYPARQLAQALATQAEHEDAATRRRADRRARRWQSVLDGMATGQIHVGSRTPLRRVPAWVTPEVIRGGFATGILAADGELLGHEIETAYRVGVPPTREALFAYYLTEPGLGELSALLDSGRYRISVPEEAALLTVAWLVRAGDRTSALDLLEVLEPWAARLRFSPRPAESPRPDSQIVWRENAGQVAAALRERKPNARVAAMNETLAVWNPFADQFLDLWLGSCVDGAVARNMPPDWRERGSALLERYASLASEHRLCAKHRRPKENLAILRLSLEHVTAGRVLDPRRLGLLQHAVDSMLRRRGRPGDERHTLLRSEQSAVGRRPTNQALAKVVIARLAGLPQETGLTAVDVVLRPVELVESAAGADRDDRGGAIAAGTAIPPSVRKVVERATAARIEDLILAGKVPSAEALARLVPSIVASAAARAYSDPVLRTLMAANYQAFSARRSLLLLYMQHQVQAAELPWVKAVAGHRREDGSAAAAARSALATIGELAITAYPGTILPNVLVQELGVLAQAGGLDLPLVRELGADIFTGGFTSQFPKAARQASRLLQGSLYERYYGIDYASLVQQPGKGPGASRSLFRRPVTPPDWFAELCAERAGFVGGGYSVAANGTVIEQAQILTTHNLAVLVTSIGLSPDGGWAPSARQAFGTVVRLIGQLQPNPRPLPLVKGAAYAWRQMIFFLSLGTAQDQMATVCWARDQAAATAEPDRARLTVLLDGLECALAGHSLEASAQAADRRPFLGWVRNRRHWLLDLPESPRAGR